MAGERPAQRKLKLEIKTCCCDRALLLLLLLLLGAVLSLQGCARAC